MGTSKNRFEKGKWVECAECDESRRRRCKKINTQARATILWKLGLVDTAKKKNEPKKAYNKQADREMPCTKCNKY